MAIGWMTDLTEADDYFDSQRFESTAWDDLSNDTDKTSCLWTAYNRILYSKRWTIPAVPTAAQLVKLKLAQEEMSYYLAIHLSDEDRRKGLQAQGVVDAGIIKEKYAEDLIEKVPFPPIVIAILEDFLSDDEFYVAEIDRDENRSVDDDVTEF